MGLVKHLAALILLLLELTRPLSSELTYAPSKVGCPKNFVIRQGNKSIGNGEREYIERRRTKLLTHAYQDYLNNLNAYIASTGNRTLVLPSYVTRILSSNNQIEKPRFSIAVGGGAYRGKGNKTRLGWIDILKKNLWFFECLLGAIFSAGVLNTLDGRNRSSVDTGIGGLLQTADYITGLSGSAWLVVSWAESELAPLFNLVLGDGGTGSSRRAGWFTQYNLFDVCECI